MISRRIVLAAGSAAGIMWAVAWSLPRDFPVGNYVDDAHYAVLAKSIRTRGTYRTLNLPDEPFETKYPPGYPALLATVWSPSDSDPDNLQRLRWVNLVLVGPLAAALTVFAVAVAGLAPWLAVALSIGCLVTPGVAALWTVPMSGVLFLLGTVVGVGLWLRGYRWAGLGVLIAVAYVRTIGSGFVIAAIATALSKREAGARRYAVAAAAGLVPWFIWQGLHGGATPPALRGIYGSYGRWYVESLAADPMTVLTRVPLQNTWLVLRQLGENLIGAGWIHGGVSVGVGVVVVVVAANGARRWPVVGLGLALYVIAMLAWPFPPDRFVHGVWALLGVLMAAGLTARTRWVPLGPILVVAVVGLLRGDVTRIHAARGEMSARLLPRIAASVGDAGPLASTNPGLHYLQLGVATVPGQKMRAYRWYRLGFWATAWGQGDDLWPVIQRYRPTHLVVEPRGVEGRYVAGSLAGQCPGVLREVWEADHALLFSVDPDAPCEPRRSAR